MFTNTSKFSAIILKTEIIRKKESVLENKLRECTTDILHETQVVTAITIDDSYVVVG